jgi:hypothetical protein
MPQKTGKIGDRVSEPQKIEVNLGFKATKNFNSVSVNIGITDSRRSDESMDEAVERIYNYVEDQVTTRLNKTIKEMKDLNK